MAWKTLDVYSLQFYQSTILDYLDYFSILFHYLFFSTHSKICWKPKDIQGTLVFTYWPGALVAV